MLASSPHITTLRPNEIFVFGSNESGIHGAGAAKFAKDHFGALQGHGFGVQGKSFAIPTKDWMIHSLPLPVISFYVQRFIYFTSTCPGANFLVTEIGCGLAGFTPDQIAPMFKEAIYSKNIFLPQSFINILTNEK